jgi:hypothetical protein
MVDSFMVSMIFILLSHNGRHEWLGKACDNLGNYTKSLLFRRPVQKKKSHRLFQVHLNALVRCS